MSDRLYIVYDSNNNKLQVTVSTALFGDPESWMSFKDIVKCRREDGSNPIEVISPNGTPYKDMVCYYADDNNVRINVLRFNAYSDSSLWRCNRNEGTGWIYEQGVQRPARIQPGPIFWKQLEDWEL
jgi:hypothetical protein